MATVRALFEDVWCTGKGPKAYVEIDGIVYTAYQAECLGRRILKASEKAYDKKFQYEFNKRVNK
jgi:hypothetical protein